MLRSLARVLILVVLALRCSSRISAAEQAGSAAAVDPDHAAKRIQGLEVFKAEVRAILKAKCVDCHGGDATEGKLDLATQEGLLKGGERGPAAVVGRGDRSLLVRLISHQQEPRMPKDGEKLSAKEIAAITKWIDLGAPFDEPLVQPKQADVLEWTQRKLAPERKKFWSFQPLLKTTQPPAVEDAHGWVASSVDRFVLAKLNETKLAPNSAVGRAELMRRVTFDLIGLPPSASDVDEFVRDERPDAYERLIERLLASPHYGERWGRRWLDLVRFAESHGFEHDYDRTSAFHYRDFVVQALNQGMPYDQFVRWQIAGDEFAPNDRLAMMATGFLAAGVHSTQITKNEVEKHRYDEMDDMLATVGTSMLGLTIGCARCHDHKFDPIPQADYYRLLSTFTTTIRSEVELDFDPEGYQRDRAEFDRTHAPFKQAVRDYAATQLPHSFAKWQAGRDATKENPSWLVPGGLTIQSQGNATFTMQPDESWLQSGTSPANDVVTISFTTQLRDVKAIRLEALAHPSFTKSGPGRAGNGNFALSEFLVTIRPVGAAADTKPTLVKLTAARATFEQQGLPVAAAIDDNPQSAWAVDPEFGKDHAAVFSCVEPFGFETGTVVTIVMKYNNNTQHSIGRPRLSVSQKGDVPATTGGAWNETILALLTKPFDQLTADEKKTAFDWYKPQDASWKQLEDRRAAHAATAPKPRVQKVLVASEGLPPVKLHTQAESEFLKETHFLRRGETNNKDAVASQGFLQVLMTNPDAPQLFQSPAPQGSRTSFQRTALTNWLLDREAGAGNLLARVIVNRLWQHHLGRGLVSTPSDFGTRGELPSHPELLDFFASELIRHNWELKPIQRLILSSRVYQQSCDTDEQRANIDRENKFFWHRPRRRLEAEAIRDAVLAVSGQLDDRLYGPGTLSETHRRRSLYFTVKRSQLVPSMTVFDAPDGTTPVAERPQTTIAPQALLLMNNPQVRDASRQFAMQLQPIAMKSLEDAIKLGYLTTVSRNPSPEELTNTADFLRQQAASYSATDPSAGLSRSLIDFCQVLFCLNEFIYTE